MTSHLCPFRYREFPRPSIFMDDPAFFKGAASGRTMAAIQTEAMGRFEQKTGRSAGSIRGISAKGNLLIEESENARRRAAL